MRGNKRIEPLPQLLSPADFPEAGAPTAHALLNSAAVACADSLLLDYAR